MIVILTEHHIAGNAANIKLCKLSYTQKNCSTEIFKEPCMRLIYDLLKNEILMTLIKHPNKMYSFLRI